MTMLENEVGARYQPCHFFYFVFWFLLSYPFNIHRSKKLHTAYKYAAIYVGGGRRHTSDKCASTTADA